MGAGFAPLPLEVLLDVGILLGSFDLLHVERNAQALGEIAFGDGEVAGPRFAGVKVLVVPIIGRRNDRSGLPI